MRFFPRLDGWVDRSSLRKLRAELPLILQIAAGASIAWYLAILVVPGNSVPVFAPIATVIVLAAAAGNRLIQLVHLVLGVAVGVAVAEVLLLVIGRGAIQLGITAALAMAVASLLGRGEGIVLEAGISGMLIATFETPDVVLIYQRPLEALVGGAVALVFAVLLFPPKSDTLAAQAAGPVVDGIARTLEAAAEGIVKKRVGPAEHALGVAGSIDESTFHETLARARRVAKHAPIRRDERRALERYDRAEAELTAAIREAEVLALAATRLVRAGERVSPELPAAVLALAEAIRRLPTTLTGEADPTDTVRAAALGAGAAAQATTTDGGFSSRLLAEQVTSLAAHVLRATGTAPAVADTVVESARRAALTDRLAAERLGTRRSA